MVMASGANFDDLTFENFQGSLDQRIILEIILAERHRGQFLSRWRRWLLNGLGGGANRLEDRHGIWRLDGPGRNFCAACGSLGFDKLDLEVWMAQFRKF